MALFSSDDMRAALSEVAKAQDGFKVIFPYGFKIVQFRGENVLQPLTPEEYKEALILEFGEDEADREFGFTNCYGDGSGGCARTADCAYYNACSPYSNGGAFFCKCG